LGGWESEEWDGVTCVFFAGAVWLSAYDGGASLRHFGVRMMGLEAGLGVDGEVTDCAGLMVDL